ncbi:cold-shock protein [Aureliella helgolandensis]|uniref:Cold shock protein CspA n=1 Tax=Aureliella helgolandensis TaxID=2527968 RepID=A0A518G5A6_9BACT|nr:cold shock domain-containing protein [Aureliella helgolandensis]QDV23740.1 Cold shock protein CspA [Aureliella helgolandensis]
MAHGVIKKLVTDKGFGFLKADGGEIFFHHSAVQGVPFESLREGQSVSFTAGSGPKGPRAEDVHLLDAPE